MRHIGFISIMAAVLLLTVYVGWHLWRITPGAWKWLVLGLFILWTASFYVGFAIMERLPIGIATVTYEVGNTWLIAFLYIFLLFVVADIATLCHLLPKSLLKESVWGLLSIFGIVAVILTLGGIHYHHKYRQELAITTEKPIGNPVTVVMASDLHIGYHNRKTELSRWVDLINAENPDLVLFGGDIIDLSLRPVIEGNYAEEFRRLKAPALAVLGNHEYYSNLSKAMQFYADAGITLLNDSVAHVNGLTVVGRNDRTDRNRKNLKELTAEPEGFTILLDHQPYHLEEAEEAGIDFQFSGHTHYGQVWPVSWVTNALYEKAWGYHKRGNTHYYVTSGLGIWGAKIRVGTRSEYLVLKIQPSTPDALVKE